MKPVEYQLLYGLLGPGSNGKQFIIPVYQRNYTWKKNDQIAKLMDDINMLLKNNESKHFIGTIITFPTTVRGFVENSVVDGQQRITTIFLIVHALRKLFKDKARENEENVSKAIPGTDDFFRGYLENTFFEKNELSVKYKYKLKPQVSDDDAYNYISKENFDELAKCDDSSNIKQNFYYIYDVLNGFIEEGYDYMSILSTLNRLYVVLIELDNSDNPQEIFESINSTGAKLSQSDLIRNFILMNKGNDEQEHLYDLYWKNLEYNTDHSRKLDSFFRFYLASKQFNLTGANKIYNAFKEYWKNVNGETNSEKILSEIKQSSEDFHRLYLSDEKDELGQVIYDFRNLHYETHAPFILGVFSLYHQGKINKDELQKTIKLTNIYFTRRILAGKEANDISRKFPSILKNVLDEYNTVGGKNFINIIESELVFKNLNTNAHLPTDAEIANNLKTANFYTLSKSKWLLDQLEMDESKVILDLKQLNIEHVMPQTRDYNWTEKTSDLSDDEYATFVNRLGNLTLVSSIDNSTMQNKNFEEKKKVLEKSNHIKLNTEILKKTDWDISDIEERTNRMIRQFEKLFPYIKSKVHIADENQIIYLYSNEELVAKGYLYQDGRVAVLADSTIDLTNETNPKISEIRNECVEEGFIEHIDEKYILKDERVFQNLSTAAEFVLGGERRNGNLWQKTHKAE
ncbi:MAG: DUF262 domain-containing HNH endonuclease family protein [Sharpea porci]|uniref:DUF262 domain-containing protein n=1 Tax=Sharpea porci TaxID=2652286 RepID=UPI0024095B8A|nr:DUF262 domain-containing HNH endonuclease family protein [Sharpea porci]MDD6712234.1 DUF262 domain-containing HNH endonuclease family protein [Sharpea porci]